MDQSELELELPGDRSLHENKILSLNYPLEF